MDPLGQGLCGKISRLPPGRDHFDDLGARNGGFIHMFGGTEE